MRHQMHERGVNRIINLWRPQRGQYFFLSTKHDGVWRDHAFRRDRLDEVPSFVRALSGCDVYWCPHGFSERRRLERYAEPSHYAWLDLDAKDPRHAPLEPIIALETSPKRYQAIWRCSHVPTKAMRRGFSKSLGADDGAWIITKLLRVPGTVNHKYTTRPTVRTLWWCDEPVVSLRSYADHDGDNRVVYRGPRPRGDGDAILAKYGVDRSLLITCIPPHDGNPGHRSSVVHKIGCLLFEAGATDDEVACAMFSSASFHLKWGDNLDRLWKEVDAARRLFD